MNNNIFEASIEILESDEYFNVNILPKVESMVEMFKPTDENQLEFEFVKEYE